MTTTRPLLSLALMAFCLAAPALAEDGATTAVEPVSAAPAISVVTLVTSTLRDRVYASGLIAPVEEIAVAPQVEGQRIEALLADVGDRVEAGQVLARLADDTLILSQAQLEASATSAQAAIAQAEATLTEARATADEAVRVRDRTEMLRGEGTVSQAGADQASSAAASALARVAATEQGLAAARAQAVAVAAQLDDVALRIERTRIAAPVGGIITSRNAQIGAIASAAGQPMFVIIRDGLLELQADVAEQDVLRLAAGQRVSLHVVGLEASQGGVVRLVEPSVDPITRLGRVRIQLDTPDAVRSGLFAEAEILVSETDAVAAPVSALNSSAGETFVLAVDDAGVVTKVEVTVGIRDGGMVELLSGLSAGDRVVARAGAFVRPGDTINPVAVAAPASN